MHWNWNAHSAHLLAVRKVLSQHLVAMETSVGNDLQCLSPNVGERLGLRGILMQGEAGSVGSLFLGGLFGGGCFETHEWLGRNLQNAPFDRRIFWRGSKCTVKAQL